MSATTIREHVHEALHAAGPHGLTMAALSGAVTGPWRTRDVEDLVRKLWQTNELGRRTDGTFVLTGKAAASEHRGQRLSRRLDAAVRRVAKDARREGHSTQVRTRTVDPALLSSYCPGCRQTVRPLLDGTCPTCRIQTGANLDGPPKPRRRRRRKPLKKGQAGWGTVCPKCGGPKAKQGHTCRACDFKRKRGRRLPRLEQRHHSRQISPELLEEARRLYASGLSIRQVAAEIHPRTSYATVNSCKSALYSLFKTRGWKLRPQPETTAARSFKHGRKARGLTREKDRAYRIWLRDQRGWNSIHGPGRPVCKGVKRQSPGKGSPCPRHALQDSEYCYSHDPRYELERQAHLARTRARATYREPLLPIGPFREWLSMLCAELGGWRHVAAVIGANQSQAKRWGDGRAQSVAVRVVRRSAENAGTTLEAIYGDIAELAKAA